MRHKSRQRRGRQHVAERAGDREAEAHIVRAKADVAIGGDAGAPARARARDGGDQRHGASSDHGAAGRCVRLVLQALFGRLEDAELRDVGACRERLAAGAGQHQRPDRPARLDAGADLGELVVHVERQRIARLGPVQGDEADIAPHLIEQFVADLSGFRSAARFGGWRGGHD